MPPHRGARAPAPRDEPATQTDAGPQPGDAGALLAPPSAAPDEAALAWILLVEDDPHVVRAQTRALHQAGYAVGHAASHAELRALLPARAWRAGLVDIGLRGGESGVDAAAFVRAALPALPMAFVTAEAEPRVLADARAIAPVFPKSAPVLEVLAIISGRPVGSGA